MVSLETLLVFCTTAFVLIITPGPNQIYIITRSTSQGRRAGIVSAMGVDTGTLVHVVCAAFGLSALLAASALAFNVVKYAGAAYLVYLGIRTWMAGVDVSGPAAPKFSSPRRMFFQGMVTNILNPKAALFFIAILPQFVDRSKGHATEQMLVLGIIFTLIGMAVDLFVAVLAGSAGDWLRRNAGFRRIQKWASGGVYLTLGVGAVLTGGDNK